MSGFSAKAWPLTAATSSVASLAESSTVLFIFQLPAMIFLRMLFPCLSGSLLVGECDDAGEGFAFEEFQRGAAAGGDVGNLFAQAGLLDGAGGIASADHG